ncbi:MAG: hypothetical protein H0X37_25835 [Herpetosiphonaceae bacterium]|nr:hypothetical protein [Herpetosiphonaceae bacterium]
MTIEAYCLKCKTTRTITAAEEHVNARGTRMAQGLCPVCGTKVTTFLPKADAATKAGATPAESTRAATGGTASKPVPKAKTSRAGGAATAGSGSTKRGSIKGV